MTLIPPILTAALIAVVSLLPHAAAAGASEPVQVYRDPPVVARSAALLKAPYDREVVYFENPNTGHCFAGFYNKATKTWAVVTRDCGAYRP